MLSSSYDKLGNDFGGNGLVLPDPSELALRLSHEPNDRRSAYPIFLRTLRQRHARQTVTNN